MSRYVTYTAKQSQQVTRSPSPRKYIKRKKKNIIECQTLKNMKTRVTIQEQFIDTSSC